MALYPVIYEIRKKYIIRKFCERNSFSPETAISFNDINLPFNNLFKAHTENLIRNNILYKTNNNKYFLNEKFRNIIYK